MTLLSTEYDVIHTDVALNMWEEPTDLGSSLRGFWQFRPDLFDAASISGMIDDFQRLLAAVTDDPAQLIQDLPLVHAPRDTQRVQ
jgi:non-ribosomal peptide synthetase component F